MGFRGASPAELFFPEAFGTASGEAVGEAAQEALPKGAQVTNSTLLVIQSVNPRCICIVNQVAQLIMHRRRRSLGVELEAIQPAVGERSPLLLFGTCTSTSIHFLSNYNSTCTGAPHRRSPPHPGDRPAGAHRGHGSSTSSASQGDVSGRCSAAGAALPQVAMPPCMDHRRTRHPGDRPAGGGVSSGRDVGTHARRRGERCVTVPGEAGCSAWRGHASMRRRAVKPLAAKTEQQGCSAEVAIELEPMESIRNSSSPRSPLGPILRWPYPSGAPEEVRSLSFWGREKKASASASSLSKRPAGIPWLTTLKKPSLPQALATVPAEPGDDRSTTGTAVVLAMMAGSTERSGLVAVAKAVMARSISVGSRDLRAS
ncbi:hypothetical protein C2845_PM08G21690 [Panicum miliaceum]|uniref:Uncharacterized protein n=1 Tax=Panicum miliaceum TaxID=4540 RepID=A0A3L6QWF4_PANMI|nr:hypothetical protein C2845_PM08G21690 [Panicum miliaceum]